MDRMPRDIYEDSYENESVYAVRDLAALFLHWRLFIP